ncbi:MAG: aldo/keto reductase [Candidatus Aenigmarchaeota archaeon]|nr:aldo/keto reductase [Candidatus Aenigmarchaeota archaeon]
MKYLKIHGPEVPVIGFGTWQITGDQCRSAVKSALDIGYRHIDTAQRYENEEEVGSAISGSGIKREEIFLVTKVWITNLRYNDVIKSTKESLKKLKTGYIDLLLIHWPVSDISVDETLNAMNKLREEGIIRHIGVSNFSVEQLKEAQKHSEIFCNQVEYHPFISQEKILRYCQQNNIMLTAYSPLARSKVNEDKTLIEIGEKYNKTTSQITLRWLIQQKNVAAIPKAVNMIHQKENFDIFDFELDDEYMKKIFALERNEKLVNPNWLRSRN